MDLSTNSARVSGIFDRRWLAVMLAVIYPTVFALSLNWYAFSSTKVLWLIGGALLFGAVLYAALEVLLAVIGRIAVWVGPQVSAAWKTFGFATVFAAVCSATLIALMDQVIQEALGSRLFVWAAFVCLLVGL